MANTLTQWRPFAWIQTRFNEKKEFRSFPTYKELKKNLKDLIEENRVEDNEVTVFRSKRGEWGEWFEKWRLEGDRLVKFKEGWM